MAPCTNSLEILLIYSGIICCGKMYQNVIEGVINRVMSKAEQLLTFLGESWPLFDISLERYDGAGNLHNA